MKRLVAIVVGLLLVGGVASAAIPDSGGVIHGCYTTSGQRGLRVVDTEAGQTCAPYETELSWNQSGPAGPQGATGPAGPAGPSTVQAGVFTYSGNYSNGTTFDITFDQPFAAAPAVVADSFTLFNDGGATQVTGPFSIVGPTTTGFKITIRHQATSDFTYRISWVASEV